MYEHIVLAADGSKNSERACKEAIKIAKLATNAKIDVVYVASFDKVKDEVLHASSSESLQLKRRQKLFKIEQLLKTENIQYIVTMLKGDPGPEIVRYVNEQQADLIIIGSRGLNSLQEMVLGSVSHKVMKRVNCPALVVK